MESFSGVIDALGQMRCPPTCITEHFVNPLLHIYALLQECSMSTNY
jgi:hypothetical protein